MIHSLIYRVEHSTAEYFLKNTLAPKSYKKIMEETREIQKRMKETFGLGLKPKNKVLGRPLSRNVFFCFLCEVPVTNWAAQ